MISGVVGIELGMQKLAKLVKFGRVRPEHCKVINWSIERRDVEQGSATVRPSPFQASEYYQASGIFQNIARDWLLLDKRHVARFSTSNHHGLVSSAAPRFYQANVLCRSKQTAFAIVEFLHKSVSDGSIREDDREGLETASACLLLLRRCSRLTRSDQSNASKKPFPLIQATASNSRPIHSNRPRSSKS